jgi:myo-inositol-1(or 4)-monophosphatase
VTQHPTSLVDLASRIAAEAGAFLLDGWRLAGRTITTKSSATDMVSEMDEGAERLLVEAIIAARPDDAILGEEGANRPGTSGVRWVIDPLDGTTNYLYGIAQWAVSIGVEYNGEAVVGVVYAPALGETYVGVKGAGAHRNGLPIGVSTEANLGLALVGTGFGYAPQRRAYQSTVVAQLLPQIRDIRRFGSAALDLCAVASGQLDAYFEVGVNPWDVCAGDIIVREAGGAFGAVAISSTGDQSGARAGETLVSDTEPGSPHRPIVAANPTVHDAFVSALISAHIGVQPV